MRLVLFINLFTSVANATPFLGHSSVELALSKGARVRLEISPKGGLIYTPTAGVPRPLARVTNARGLFIYRNHVFVVMDAPTGLGHVLFRLTPKLELSYGLSGPWATRPNAETPDDLVWDPMNKKGFNKIVYRQTLYRRPMRGVTGAPLTLVDVERDGRGEIRDATLKGRWGFQTKLSRVTETNDCERELHEREGTGFKTNPAHVSRW